MTGVRARGKAGGSVRAVRWDGENKDELWGPGGLFVGADGRPIAERLYAHVGDRPSARLIFAVYGGEAMAVNPGDWIVRDADGSMSVMSDEVFRASYEPVPEVSEQPESTAHPVAVLVSQRLLDEMLDRWSDPCQVRITATPGYGTGWQLEARVVTPSSASLIRPVGRPLYAEGETVADPKDPKPDPKVPSQDPKPRPIPRQGTVDRLTH